MTAFLIQKLIRIYQRTLSPNHGPLREYWKARGMGCRFYPTCSQYTADAVSAHGAFYGLVLGAKRIARCRPGGGAGHDPVTH